MTQDDQARELARRNRRMALIHAAIALGFVLAFAWSQLHRH